MRDSVTAKLFVAIFGSSLLVALAMGVAARVSFAQEFLGYVNEKGRARMEAVMPELVDQYREHGNWNFLRGNQREWLRLIRPPRPLPERPGAKSPKRPVLPEAEMTGLNLRVAVLDQDHQLIVGYPEIGPAAETRELLVDGKVIGWLAMAPFDQVTVEADVRFQRQQLRANLIIGALAALLAALVALGLARAFLAPVRRMAGATRRLAAGHYTTRVAITSNDEIGRLGIDFNQLAITLEKNEQTRRAFMADVSHELRTPLAVLQGELEAIEDGLRPLTPASIRSLQMETRHINQLVNDLYDLSLSDAGALVYRKAKRDVTVLLNDCLELYWERFAAQGLKMVPPENAVPFPVLADQGRLRQLFVNLLENSLRYTDATPDGSGQLRIGIRRDAHRVRIDFEDSAPGVPDALLPQLFERFYRVESSRNRANGGAGLGLAICRNIAEAHGGQLVAAGSNLGGMHMTLWLPLLNG